MGTRLGREGREHPNRLQLDYKRLRSPTSTKVQGCLRYNKTSIFNIICCSCTLQNLAPKVGPEDYMLVFCLIFYSLIRFHLFHSFWSILCYYDWYDSPGKFCIAHKVKFQIWLSYLPLMCWMDFANIADAF